MHLSLSGPDILTMSVPTDHVARSPGSPYDEKGSASLETPSSPASPVRPVSRTPVQQKSMNVEAPQDLRALLRKKSHDQGAATQVKRYSSTNRVSNRDDATEPAGDGKDLDDSNPTEYGAAKTGSLSDVVDGSEDRRKRGPLRIAEKETHAIAGSPAKVDPPTHYDDERESRQLTPPNGKAQHEPLRGSNKGNPSSPKSSQSSLPDSKFGAQRGSESVRENADSLGEVAHKEAIANAVTKIQSPDKLQGEEREGSQLHPNDKGDALHDGSAGRADRIFTGREAIQHPDGARADSGKRRRDRSPSDSEDSHERRRRRRRYRRESDYDVGKDREAADSDSGYEREHRRRRRRRRQRSYSASRSPPRRSPSEEQERELRREERRARRRERHLRREAEREERRMSRKRRHEQDEGQGAPKDNLDDENVESRRLMSRKDYDRDRDDSEYRRSRRKRRRYRDDRRDGDIVSADDYETERRRDYRRHRRDRATRDEADIGGSRRVRNPGEYHDRYDRESGDEKQSDEPRNRREPRAHRRPYDRDDGSQRENTASPRRGLRSRHSDDRRLDRRYDRDNDLNRRQEWRRHGSDMTGSVLDSRVRYNRDKDRDHQDIPRRSVPESFQRREVGTNSALAHNGDTRVEHHDDVGAQSMPRDAGTDQKRDRVEAKPTLKTKVQSKISSLKLDRLRSKALASMKKNSAKPENEKTIWNPRN